MENFKKSMMLHFNKLTWMKKYYIKGYIKKPMNKNIQSQINKKLKKS